MKMKLSYVIVFWVIIESVLLDGFIYFSIYICILNVCNVNIYINVYVYICNFYMFCKLFRSLN